MGVDLVRECQRCLAQVADEVEGGLLYVDEGAGEALHYMGGLPFVLQLGVRSVCSLENASPLDAAVAWQGGRLQKVVVLTARLLSDAHRYILRCLRCHPNVKKCTIWTSISEKGHSACFETPLGHNAFSEYESLLQQDLQSSAKSDDLELVVKHAPLLMCALTPNLFVLPSSGAEAEAPLSDHKTGSSLGPGLPAIDTSVTLDIDDRIPSGASLLGHFLQQLTAQLDVKVDVFSLGPLAHLVGNLVTDLPTSAMLDHGSQRKSAGLLLVDRSLDLITPTCHNDNFMDLVVYSLLRRPTVLPPSRPQVSGSESQPLARKPMDFRVPTGSSSRPQNGENGGVAEFPLFPCMTGWDCKTQKSPISVQNDSSGAAEEDKAQVMMGGSLAAPWDQSGLFSLESMLDKSTKDATLLLRKWFHEALRSEKQPMPAKARLGAMTSAELASLQTALSAKPDMTIRHLDLLQVARAMEEVRSGDKRSKWEAVSSAEKILRLSVNDGSQSIALQLSDMVQQISNDGMLDLSDVLTLAIVGYALAGEASPKGFSNGPFSWEEEAVLTDSLLDAILKGPADVGFPSRLKRALESHWERSKGKKSAGEKNADLQEVNDDWGEWEGLGEESEDEEYLEAHLKLEIRDWLQDLMSCLHSISQARARLPVSLRSTEEQVFATGLLQHMFSLIFSKSDVPGLHHHISSVGRIFKSGLGRFGLGQPKPKLGDHKLIIVFVIGGISGTEIRDIKEAQVGLPGAEGVEVLIGGTTFLSPSDMRDLLLASHSAL